MDDQNAALKEELSELRREGKARDKKLSKAQEDLATAKETVKACRADTRELERKVKRLEAEKTKADSAHRREVARLAVAAGAGLRTPVGEEASDAQVEARLAALRETLASVEEENSELLEENSALASTVERLTLEHNSVVAELNDAWSDRLQDHMRQAAEALTQKETQLKGIQEAHTLLGVNLGSAEDALKKAHKTNEELERRLNDYASGPVGGRTLEELTREADQARELCIELQTSVEELKQLLRDSHMAVERLEVEKVDLEAQIRVLNKHHEAAHLALVQEFAEELVELPSAPEQKAIEATPRPAPAPGEYFQVLREVEAKALALTEELDAEKVRRDEAKKLISRHELEEELAATRRELARTRDDLKSLQESLGRESEWHTPGRA